MAGIPAEGERVMHKDATPEALDAELLCRAMEEEKRIDKLQSKWATQRVNAKAGER